MRRTAFSSPLYRYIQYRLKQERPRHAQQDMQKDERRGLRSEKRPSLNFSYRDNPRQRRYRFGWGMRDHCMRWSVCWIGLIVVVSAAAGLRGHADRRHFFD